MSRLNRHCTSSNGPLLTIAGGLVQPRREITHPVVGSGVSYRRTTWAGTG